MKCDYCQAVVAPVNQTRKVALPESDYRCWVEVAVTRQKQRKDLCPRCLRAAMKAFINTLDI